MLQWETNRFIQPRKGISTASSTNPAFITEALMPPEIQIFMSSAHIIFDGLSDWSSETLATNGVGVNIQHLRSSLQYKANFYTNLSGNGPRLMNHSVGISYILPNQLPS